MLDAEAPEEAGINIKHTMLPEVIRDSSRPFDGDRDVPDEKWQQILSYADELRFLIDNTSSTTQEDRFNDLVRKLSSVLCSIQIVSPAQFAAIPRRDSFLLKMVTAAANTKIAAAKRLQLYASAATLFPEKRDSLIIPPEFERDGKDWCRLKLTQSTPATAAEYYIRLYQLLGHVDFPREEIVKSLTEKIKSHKDQMNVLNIQSLAFLKILDARAATHFVDSTFWRSAQQFTSEWIHPIYRYTEHLAHLTILSADETFITPQGIQLRFNEKKEKKSTSLPVLKAR